MGTQTHHRQIVLLACAALSVGCTLPDAPGSRYDAATEQTPQTDLDAPPEVAVDRLSTTEGAVGDNATDVPLIGIDSVDEALVDVGVLDVTACPPGQLECVGRCVDIRGDTQHCGRCGNACNATNGTPSCTGGVCGIACSAGYGNCDANEGNGCEAALLSDAVNCGACGTRCTMRACSAGRCPAPMTVQRSCAGTPKPLGCGLATVVGGAFTMGAPTNCSGTPDATCGYRAAPEQAGITVSTFALDAFEVTVDRFRAFWRERMASASPSVLRANPIRYRDNPAIAWGAAAQDPLPLDSSCNWSMTDASATAHPMNCIDWWLAQEFCTWDGGRLPTEAEWEYAARGRAVSGLVAGRVYPWGSTPPSSTCDLTHWNYCPGTDGRRTRRVDAFASSAGLYGLAGSLLEWTADNYGTYPSCRMSTNNPLCNNSATGFRVVRGGSWYGGVVSLLRSASRDYDTPAYRNVLIGFRCARDTP